VDQDPGKSSAASAPLLTNCPLVNFHDIFKIRADLSNIINGINRPTGQNKRIQYFKLDYEIIILFGTTEFKAQYA
jgi:hypothetical protein